MPPSPGKQHRSDTMKDTILKESTAGWSNSISPLRIAKREMTPTGLSPTPNVARRSSNSYKHVFNNNLVSKSPFKSQIPTPSGGARSSPRNFVVPSPRGARKVSGEKRPRPDSLVKQAEVENQQRVKELGFKRRQSKGFQGLAEKEPVTKSPFRRIVSPNNIQEPIAIELPTKGYSHHDIKEEDTTDTTSVDTTDLDTFTGKNDVFATVKSVQSPIRPLTPSSQPSHSLPFTPSPGLSNRPIPSVNQVSPTRSSLVQRPRLLGPRSRSFSNSPADTPRKTVTFNDGVDVVEFDRASHEDRIFDTDDEDVYGPPDGQQEDESSFESNGSYNNNATPTYQSPNSSREYNRPSAMEIFNHVTAVDDSISGLVDSMLQEASAFSVDHEPTTPDSHQESFNLDADLVKGGVDNGVPHGRMHHSERIRMEHQQEHPTDQPRLPSAFENDTLQEEEPSFSSISLSTPPRQTHSLPNVSQKQSQSRTPLPVLPPDTELAEDGMPLGRTHHADRARVAHQKDKLDMEAEKSIDMIPPSPSPMRKKAIEHGDRSKELPDPLLPKFDLGIDFDLPKSMERSRSFVDDVFGSSEENAKFLANLSFEHPDIDPDILSNTSIASFHDFPPHAGYEEPIDENHDSGRQSPHDHSGVFNNERSNLSLDASVASIVHELQVERGRERTTTASSNDVEIARSDVKVSEVNAKESPAPPQQPPERVRSPVQQLLERVYATVQPGPKGPERSFTPDSSPRQTMPGSKDSSSSSGSARRSPRVSREDVMRRLIKQRSVDNMSPLGGTQIPSPAISPIPLSPAPASPSAASSMHRQPLEERLRRALSPTAVNSTQNSALPSPVPEEQLAPSRPDLYVRAHTYDANGRPLPVTPLSATFDLNQPGVDIADMRSALDRLVQDVGGPDASDANISANNSRPDRSDGDISMADTELCTEEGSELLANLKASFSAGPLPLQRISTAPTLPSTLLPSFTPQSRSASGGSIPPAPPPKENGKSARQMREELIREKRREARARDSGEFIPPRRDAAGNLLEGSPSQRRSSGRPSARRSLSTGDAEDLLSTQDAARRRVSVLRNQRGGVLGGLLEDEEAPLTASIEKELRKKMEEETRKKTYELREHEVVYASSSAEESISHMSQVGDLDSGKAWRAVRRPSDMNEYSRQIKELRAQEKTGKNHGKVFVKVLHVKGLNVPLPLQRTLFTLTLNNGIHFVTTPEGILTLDARIDQEFELIEHTKLEFTLTLKVRRDPHIVQQFKSLAPPPLPPQPPLQPHRSGMRSFFGGSPKKPKHVRANTEPIVRPVMEENLARYLKPDGTLARTFVSFKEIASRCDTRLFETSYPLIGQRLEPGEGAGAGGTMVPKQIGEIVLQVFRLPPLPGIAQSDLPQSLDDCHRGLRHINWHKVTYHEGVLTQLGGDCSTWRRRQLRVIGGNLVAFNDVTKRATATIDLKKAISVEDDQERAQSPGARAKLDVDDFDAMYGVERSFRLIFPHKQEIAFFADTDDEKARWLDVFRALVGHIPPNPLWAELVWQRQNELSKAQGSSQATGPSFRKR